MRLRLSKNSRKKLPISDDEVPLKTKENLEEYLQSAISFLQTQQSVLERTLAILEEIAELAETMKADVIRSISKEQEKESRKKFWKLRKNLKVWQVWSLTKNLSLVKTALIIPLNSLRKLDRMHPRSSNLLHRIISNPCKNRTKK